MKGKYVETKRTTVTPEELREALRELLSKRGIEASEHALTGLVAMSAHETGSWNSCYNYNLGNVKAGTDWPGLYMCLKGVWEVLSGVTRWFDPDGETVGRNGPPKGPRHPVPPGHPQTRFRAYPSLRDGVEGWVIKMTTTYKRSTQVLLDGGSTDLFLASLKAQKYFTGDLEKYQASVRSFYTKFNAPRETRRTLRQGMTGDDVKGLQSTLGLVTDGQFGPITDAAVRRFQERYGLVADGVVGPKTWAYVDKVRALTSKRT